jgi:hypothetical protein
MKPISRSYSDKFVSGISEYDLFKNKNQDWIRYPFTIQYYIISIFLFWGILHLTRLFSPEDCWTATNVGHGVVSNLLKYYFKVKELV